MSVSAPVLEGLPECDIRYIPDFLESREAESYFQELLISTPWKQDSIRLFGKTYPQPRLTALYGDNGKSYSYSGIEMHPLPFTNLLKGLKKEVELYSRESFTTCLLNLYRDGSDSNGWHADDEPELGRNPAIASVSLGAPRMFHLKHRERKEWRHRMVLEPGSLLLMLGATQHRYLHQLPKTRKPVRARINLTFRRID